MAKSKQTYEEIRQKRMEENKKRMKELNLTKLSQSLLSKPSPVKKAKPRTFRQATALTPVRRSTRVADKPTVSYKELPVEPMERTRRSYSYRRRGFGDYASSEARAHAIDKAEQIQSRLGADFPSFLKPMVQSHVSGCFWLGLPAYFCKSHLPLSDEVMTLEDENGDEFQTKYLAQKTGLSGGWRGFSIDHELVDGDALVFQLVSPTRFKVYIARAYDSEDNENKEDMVEDNEGKENTDNDKNSDSKHLDGIAKRTRAKSRVS
ncbi:B3 DOMAIN-CONTAINING PROTEIN-RELATED [Salix purpurea]|uniref:B3 DOMAIN-CONTAINING PROTEIN-RELATED n=1 Tax=Salix purpurea TaxID=77065 RepID=A0A9Q0PQJ0_SALPP|nr:B3 DOMAIN-CONTAINING PROTEIN-RELATED [Salix purpurea]